MSNQEFNISTIVNYIFLLTQQPNAKENLALLLESLFDFTQKEKAEEVRKDKAASSIVLFTTKELSKMPQQFRKIFKIGNVRAHVKRRPDGLYEIRCQINKTLYVATSKYLDICKDKFIEKLKTVKVKELQPKKSTILFNDYILNWLETAKKPFVKEGKYKDYIQTTKAYLLPKFEKRALISIQYGELQAMITQMSDSGKNRTAKKIYQLLSALFEHAVADGVITLSPMAKVKLARYEEVHGVPLTKEEEYALLQEFKRNPSVYNQAYAFIMYTGLRRSELASVVIEGEWIILTTAKQRKGYKEKVRSMPMPPMLKTLMPLINVDEIKKLAPHILTKHLKIQFDNHHLHDLRHTFITRAQECGIRRGYASMWAGHKADTSITSNVYTHLEQNKDVQIEEMKKFQYKL